MESFLDSDIRSHYKDFSQNFSDDQDEDGNSRFIPVIMIDLHDSILYETEGCGLLDKIIGRNDVDFLKRYLAITPWAVPRTFCHPENEIVYRGLDDVFELAIQSRVPVDRRVNGVDIKDMIYSPDSHGSLLIYYATRNQLPELPNILPTPIIQRIVQNISSTIDILLDLAPDTINTKDDHKNLPLHYVTQYFGRNSNFFTPIFNLLCNRDVDASIRNNNNETPLHGLLYRDGNATPVDPAVVTLLVSHDANPTAVDEADNTPLHLAAPIITLLMLSHVRFGTTLILHRKI
ncbi:ankyrin protein [Fusarium heterosporum]|uniref:Ankyrin protein n=1 Tax=Fusarium heterosporum TaxID=42747 RepID=A0A8H5TRL7_FUSHE|nr:ankyrin protein [Fusarium heterosporum]